jgi:hypothetical protein
VTKPVQAGTGQQPVGTLFEVFRRILQQRTEGDALRAVALMRQGRVVELYDTLALGAARLSFDLGLPLADSIILHTARLRARAFGDARCAPRVSARCGLRAQGRAAAPTFPGNH